MENVRTAQPDMATAGSALSGEDIVCLAHEPWHGPWKLYHQVMSLLARSNRVLYIGPPRSLRESIDGLRRRTAREPVLERVTETLWVYHEPALFARAATGRRWSQPFNTGTARLRLAHARWVAGRQGMRSPILWVFDPLMAHAVGKFREKFLVYYVLDNYVEFFAPEETSLRAAVAKNEAAMLAEADLVFAVSETLTQRCARANPHTLLVPNGVDYDRFQAAIVNADIPPDMRTISRPIIGYVGVIQPDLDLPLLERIASDQPGWSLVFVGPQEFGGDRFHTLTARPNVHYLGSKPVRDVPLYINACDVCVMPNDVGSGSVPDSDSVKVYEYLACGRPVVATDIPSVRRFSPLVRIARTHGEFIESVKDCLAEDPRRQAERKAVAREHSWQRRVDVLSAAIRSRLPAGAATAPRGCRTLKDGSWS